ncbi:MAG: CcoQ/FixQ family Cbb3-type cytochrome c oxidase assembly chaperone [Rhodobacterales bacterium CG15_BIG_FIL_POST_REV_8_21_14_020_59_13]|nr:MAG: CcoQ/FixQ family Cbb3-type cytochrome c oxidase assembly chaperone [Rhodobacterales bacterium CG15_BIG_FIL_POST_REV_8_21_14_020_59_13]
MYEALASFAQTWGLLFFFAVFIGVLVYALWPKNREKFDAAARMPLNDDAPPSEDGKKDESDV